MYFTLSIVSGLLLSLSSYGKPLHDRHRSIPPESLHDENSGAIQKIRPIIGGPIHPQEFWRSSGGEAILNIGQPDYLDIAVSSPTVAEFYLNMWIDYNGDGNLTPDELLCQDVKVMPRTNYQRAPVNGMNYGAVEKVLFTIPYHLTGGDYLLAVELNSKPDFSGEVIDLKVETFTLKHPSDPASYYMIPSLATKDSKNQNVHSVTTSDDEDDDGSSIKIKQKSYIHEPQSVVPPNQSKNNLVLVCVTLGILIVVVMIGLVWVTRYREKMKILADEQARLNALVGQTNHLSEEEMFQ